jgi:hypothetical protein
MATATNTTMKSGQVYNLPTGTPNMTGSLGSTIQPAQFAIAASAWNAGSAHLEEQDAGGNWKNVRTPDFGKGTINSPQGNGGAYNGVPDNNGDVIANTCLLVVLRPAVAGTADFKAVRLMGSPGVIGLTCIVTTTCNLTDPGTENA